MNLTADTPIIKCLQELKFSRPAWTQKMLDAFIKIAKQKCLEHESDGTFNNMIKPKAILEAIRKAEVGSDIIIHNDDMSVWCILTKKCEEHEEEGV